ncbi:MAG: T9SS type A sorting domain-containing protein, partial [Bacteroidota bacterium]
REDPSSTIEVYDTETGEKEFLQLSVARSEFNGIAYEGRIFFAGGNLGGIGPYTHRVDVLGEPFEPTSTYRNLSENLVYYPNPVSRSLKVEVYKHNEFPLSYEIFSLAGKKMYEGTLKTPFQEIHLENLQKGIYLLKFEGIKGIGKLVKQ